MIHAVLQVGAGQSAAEVDGMELEYARLLARACVAGDQRAAALQELVARRFGVGKMGDEGLVRAAEEFVREAG